MTIEKKKISKFALFLIAISFLMLSGILIYNHYQKQNQVDISSTELNQKEKVVDEKLKNYVCKYLEDSNQNEFVKITLHKLFAQISYETLSKE